MSAALRASLALIALSIAALTAALWLGPVAIDPFSQDEATVTIVWEIRFPRALTAWIVGAALGLSGAALQGLLRNPLADSGVLGLSGFAALGAVIAFVFGFAFMAPLMAIAFAALAVAAGKRASELARAGGAGRSVLHDYTPGFLAQVQTLGAGGALVAYVLWAFELSDGDGSLAVELSAVPFALALLRYLLLSAHGRTEAPEEAILSDRVLAAAGAAWAVLFAVGIGW